jgi:hypothetical protein
MRRMQAAAAAAEKQKRSQSARTFENAGPSVGRGAGEALKTGALTFILTAVLVFVCSLIKGDGLQTCFSDFSSPRRENVFCTFHCETRRQLDQRSAATP